MNTKHLALLLCGALTHWGAFAHEGHGLPGSRLGVAGEYAGVNSNVLTDEDLYDPISGTSVLNGIPVALSAG